MATDVVVMSGDERAKQEERKLRKYNNIYDKLRKKRDLLESLTVQRKFLSHFKSIKEKTGKELS